MILLTSQFDGLDKNTHTLAKANGIILLLHVYKEKHYSNNKETKKQ